MKIKSILSVITVAVAVAGMSASATAASKTDALKAHPIFSAAAETCYKRITGEIRPHRQFDENPESLADSQVQAFLQCADTFPALERKHMETFYELTTNRKCYAASSMRLMTLPVYMVALHESTYIFNQCEQMEVKDGGIVDITNDPTVQLNLQTITESGVGLMPQSTPQN